jgi:hypothetical protein
MAPRLFRRDIGAAHRFAAVARAWMVKAIQAPGFVAVISTDPPHSPADQTRLQKSLDDPSQFGRSLACNRIRFRSYLAFHSRIVAIEDWV